MRLGAWIYTRGEPADEYDSGPSDIIAFFRGHPNLHGWMEKLWLKKNSIPIDRGDQFIEGKYHPCDLFGEEVELTRDDINQLEKDVVSKKMQKFQTTGLLFFGTSSDDFYQKTLLDACNDARWNLFLKRRVFYNSTWKVF